MLASNIVLTFVRLDVYVGMNWNNTILRTTQLETKTTLYNCNCD